MDRLGTYRGYEISVNLHSDGARKCAKWHSSIQIGLVGRTAPEPRFASEPVDSTPGEARERAVRIAKSIIDDRPDALPVSDDDLSED